MKRFLIIALPTFALGAIFGAAFWYLASPLWIDQVVSETLTQTTEATGAEVIATGTLRDADAVHRGTGQVLLVALADGGFEVQLTMFEVTNGPDLEVWLSAHPDPQKSADVKGADWLALGQLKGNIGDQAYRLPEGANPADYKSLVIWCEQFGVLFSPAPLS